MSDELKVTAWITEESLRRLEAGGNDSRETVPVHARLSKIAYRGLVLRTDAERLLVAREARIAELGRALDEATATTKTLREAADELLEACDTSDGACDTSDGCCYGTLSTSFVKQVLGERGTDRDALVAQLERERDEALLDAKRYRWLRAWLHAVGLLEHVNAAHRPDGTHGPTTILRRPSVINGSEFVGWSAGVGQGSDDAAIDAAMRGE